MSNVFANLPDPWKLGTLVYLILLVVSFSPVVRAIRRKVELNDGGAGFETSEFSDDTKKRLKRHYSRIQGTLGYWKNQAELYKSMHYYGLVWTIPSTVLIPVLTP